MSLPVIPQTAGSTIVYIIAGSHHSAIALDRSRSNELPDVIEVRAGTGSAGTVRAVRHLDPVLDWTDRFELVGGDRHARVC